MNARYLIFGSLAALLLVVGVLLFAADGGGEPVARGEARPAPEALGIADPTDGGDTASTGADAVAEDDPARDAPIVPRPSGSAGPDGEPVTGPSDASARVSGTGQGSAGGQGSTGVAGAQAGGGAQDAGTQASAAQDPDVAEILRATSRRYEDVRALQAGFEQELVNPLLGRTTRSAGTLYQRQPDRFLMRFSQPEGDVIVSDGEYFWLYYPSVDAKQVIRTRRGAQGLDLRSQFVGDPVRRFEAEHHGREAVDGRPAHVLTLTPREPLGYRRLKVWIDTRDHLVRRFELTEENGNVRRFRLQDLRINPSLPDRLFEFEPPPGTHVVNRG